MSEACRIERGVFVLRLDVGLRDLDRRQLVAADAPPQDFVQPLLGVELPFARVVERDRERPIVVAEDQRLRAVALELDLMLGIIG